MATQDHYTADLTFPMSECTALNKRRQVRDTSRGLLWTNRYTLVKSELPLHSLWTVRYEGDTRGR